ncbi:MAG: DUF2723 domain-containing protein [Rikenellaceae bacterium]|nr:DUF2723 domain-containing protein [Rikenellaceae bacterium]
MNYFKKCNRWIGWGVFLVATTVYMLTIESSASLWDCMEFIATSYKLEVGHPPGAPLFMMMARLFTLLAGGNTTYVPMMVNAMSGLASAFTILFLFWTITHIARKMYAPTSDALTKAQTWTVMGAGAVGALAYTFTDTFWFSAVEGEVYAMSSMFTAMVVWAMLKWEEVADEPHSNRWLVLIAYLMGLSIGVHILNLLTIPALVFIYYFRKTSQVSWRGIIITTIVAFAILMVVNSMIIPWTVAIGATVDRLFVNALGLPINSGLIFFVVALALLLAVGVWLTYKRGMVLWNTILLCVAVIMIGYSSYASVVIRASANPPMNSNDPDNPYGLLRLLNRDQYGDRPLLYGPTYSSIPEDVEYETVYYVGDDGKYESVERIKDYVYPSKFKFFFPRMYSPRDSHIKAYKSWGDVKGRKIRYDYQGPEGLESEYVNVPTFGENLRYFFSYQLNFMYWRYFLWNFAGRQSDVQSTGEITDGNWISGIKFIDQLYLGPQDNLPSDIADNKGHNRYYFLPLILGIVGLVYQLSRDQRNFSVVMWLFVMMGVALVVYFNTTPGEPRERDYVYAGSFYAFCMWIGLGVMALKEGLINLFRRDNVALSALATVVCLSVPAILAAENWDDHDRSGRTVGVDLGHNYMVGALPNSIVMNYGDNDTFPLWYHQEVDGFRPDVRIMNMSYLGGDWYIDEMKMAYNESEPVPFSLPRRSYVASTNDYISVEDVFPEATARQVIDWVASENPRTKAGYRDEQVDYIPTSRILLPVNKENVLASGIVRPEDAHLIEDTLVLKLSSKRLDKSELMLLDLLASFDWKRPLFFTQSYALRSLGLQDYLQFDGSVYRFVPIYTKYEDPLFIGRVDSETLYNNIINNYRWGGVSNPDVYVDSFVAHNFAASHGRHSHVRLAETLLAEGDTLRAVEVLDHAFEVLPQSQFRDNYMITTPAIEAYYKAGAFNQGDQVLLNFADSLLEYIYYYSQFEGRWEDMVADDFEDKLANLQELYRLAVAYNRDEIADYLYNSLM